MQKTIAARIKIIQIEIQRHWYNWRVIMDFNFKKLFLLCLVLVFSHTQAGWGWHALCEKATSFLANKQSSVKVSAALVAGAVIAGLAAKYIYDQSNKYEEFKAIVFKNYYAYRPYSRSIFSPYITYAHTEKHSLSIELDAKNKPILYGLKKGEKIKLLGECEKIYCFYKNSQLIVLCENEQGLLLMFEYDNFKLVKAADIINPKNIKAVDVERINLFRNKLVLVSKASDDCIYPSLFSGYEELEQELEIKYVDLKQIKFN